MAEIISRGNNTRHAIKVDLTPMVDLGFLLITFFVFTTTMARPKVMDLVTPFDKTTAPTLLCNSCVLTVIPGSGNRVFYYEGQFDPAAMQQTDMKGIRQVMLNKLAAVKKSRGSADQMTLIIKGTEAARFGSFVDVTDEVAINGIKRYFIDELTLAEKETIAE